MVPGGDIITIAGTGPALWRALHEPATVDAVVEQLASAYGAPTAVVAEDVRRVLDELQAAGLVELDGAG